MHTHIVFGPDGRSERQKSQRLVASGWPWGCVAPLAAGSGKGRPLAVTFEKKADFRATFGRDSVYIWQPNPVVMGLKQITDLVNIGGSVTESGANTYTEAIVNINLSPVDRQVFVITDVQFTSFEPDATPATTTEVQVQVSKVPQNGMLNPNSPDLVSRTQKIIFGGVAEFSMFETDFKGTSASTGGRNDYLMILATEDAHLGIVGVNNAGAKQAQCRITGYFATADVATYNSLVLSELQG